MSILSLVLITIDRLKCVLRPLQYRKRSKRRSKIVCIIAWIVTLTVLSFYYYLLDRSKLQVKLKRRIELSFYAALIFPATILITGIYFYIWILVRKSNNSITKLQQESNPETVTNNDRKHKERRLMHISISIVVVFFICWLPMAFISLLMLCGINKQHGISIAFALAIANSFINPLIYLFFNRKSIYKWFKGMCCKNTSSKKIDHYILKTMRIRRIPESSPSPSVKTFEAVLDKDTSSIVIKVGSLEAG
ncbi:trace amine-associated receptor 13c-like [Clytia hemisphaerica]|uniref:trace amine-associated receptor 13c-like n=1 Tax=Clytia hemisphaerica TaxID=252671 RepID=UPI0034D6458C